jgi:hypothetical protein
MKCRKIWIDPTHIGKILKSAAVAPARRGSTVGKAGEEKSVKAEDEIHLKTKI